MVESVKLKSSDYVVQTNSNTGNIDLTNREYIVFRDHEKNTVNFFSYVDNSVHYIVPGPQYDEEDQSKFSSEDCLIQTSPDSNYLFAANLSCNSQNTILSLIGLKSKKQSGKDRKILDAVDNKFDKLSYDQSNREFAYPAELHKVINRSKDEYLCEIAINEARNWIATFTEEGAYSYKLWQINDQPYGPRLKCMKTAKWTLSSDTVDPYSEIRSISFNKSGDKLALLHTNKYLEICDVTSGKIFITTQIEMAYKKAAVFNGGVCRWIQVAPDSQNAQIVAIFKMAQDISFFDIAKEQLSIVSTDEILKTIETNPESPNRIAIGTANGKLLIYDIRSPFKESQVLLPSPGEIAWSAFKNQRIQWHSNEPHVLLYVTPGNLYVFDERYMTKFSSSITANISDACFY